MRQNTVAVVVDSDGAFNIETHCINTSRGNAGDHLASDIVRLRFGGSA
jgi:hypothetical protein